MSKIVQKPQLQLMRKDIQNKQIIQQHEKSYLDQLSEKLGAQNVAYILMIFSCVTYPAGFLYTNQNNFNVCETFLIRAIAIVFVNVLIAKYFQMDIMYKNPQNFRILLMRSFCITIQNIGYTVCQFYLSQPVVQTLNATGPLFIFIVDYMINNVTITRKQFIGVMVGVAGVLLTINGELIMKFIDPTFQNKSDFKNYASDNPLVKFLLALAFLFGNVLFAYGQVIIKRLDGMNSIQINLHLGIFFLFTTGLFYPTQVTAPVQIYKIIIAIFVGGFLLAIGQIAFVKAVSLTKNTGVLTMFIFLCVIEGYLISIFMYNQTINPACTVGTLLIVYGLARIVLKSKQEKQKQRLKLMQEQVD